MKFSLGISNFLESLVFPILLFYFFALITEEGFPISPCYSLELCIKMEISFLFSFAFTSLLFTAICKASSDNHFAFLHFFFLGIVLITTMCSVVVSLIAQFAKESACNAGDPSSIPGLGRSPGEVKGYPLQYTGLEISLECIVRGVKESQTRLSDFHFHSLSCAKL